MLDKAVDGIPRAPTEAERAVLDLICSQYPNSAGLLVVGSSANRLNGIGTTPRDLDLLLIVDELTPAFTMHVPLNGITHPVELYATTALDFTSRIAAGDVEFRSMIRDSYIVHACPSVRDQIARLHESNLCPTASQIGRLFAFAAAVGLKQFTRRERRARFIAAAQGLLVAYGIEPPEPRAILSLLPLFVEKGLAPEGFPIRLFSSCAYGGSASDRSWIERCFEMAVLAATSRCDTGSTKSDAYGAIEAVLCDLGGTLTDGDALLDPSISSTLEGLARTYRLGLVSNAPATVKNSAFWEDWTRHFHSVLLSGEVGIAKPDPEIFLRACTALSVSPSRVVFVGDNLETDVCGALRCGMRAIWVHPAAMRCKTVTARLGVSPTVDELPQLLEGWTICNQA